MEPVERKKLIVEAFKSGNPKLKAMLLKHFVLLRQERLEENSKRPSLAKQILLSEN